MDLLSRANCADGCCWMGGEKGADSWSDLPARGQHSRCIIGVQEKVGKPFDTYLPTFSCTPMVHRESLVLSLVLEHTNSKKQLINNFRLALSGICHSIKLSFKKTKLAA